MSEERSEPRFTISRSSKLEQYGLKATKIYAILLFGGLPVLSLFGIVKFEQLSLNEVGDFLAGAFGPLALFWLVLGFFQQGDELRNSVEALKLQAEELRNSVDQQRELVEVSRQAIEFEKNSVAEEEAKRLARIKPRLEISIDLFTTRDDKYIYRINLVNYGADAFEVVIESKNPEIANFTKKFPAIKNEGWKERGTFSSEFITKDFKVCISCKDQEGNDCEFCFELSPTERYDFKVRAL